MHSGSSSAPDTTDYAEGAGRLGWGALALLAAVQFSAYVDRALPAVTAPLFRADLALSDSEIGLLQGPAFVALYVVGLLCAGHWARAGNPWWIALGCLAAWTCGGIAFALAPSFEWMFAGRLLLGAGQAVFIPTALMLIAGQMDPARRARGLSFFTTASASGRSGALLLGGVALFGLAASEGLAGWRLASLAVIAPNLALAVLLVVCAVRVPPPAAPRSHQGLGAALRAAAKRPAAFASNAIAGAGWVLVIQAGGAWTPSLLNRRFDITAGESAMAYGLVVLVFAPIGHLSAGGLMAWSSRKRGGPAGWVALALALSGLCAAGLPAAERLPTLALLAGLTAAAGLAAASILIGLQSMTEPPLRPAVGAMFFAVISVIGVAGGPWLTGLISDQLQGGSANPLTQALAATAIGGCLAGVILCLIAGKLWRPAPHRGAPA